MSKQEYFVRVYQPEDFPMIEVMISRGEHQHEAYLGAQVGIDFLNCNGGPASLEVVITGSIGLPHRPTLSEAAGFVRWYNLARSAGECLAGLIQTVDDLRRPVEAMIEGDTVVVRFKDDQT